MKLEWLRGDTEPKAVGERSLGTKMDFHSALTLEKAEEIYSQKPTIPMTEIAGLQLLVCSPAESPPPWLLL